MSDSVTILQARGRRLCKTIAADGSVRGYDSAKTFDLFERAVSSLADLHALLVDLAGQADRCIVRGAIADPSRTRGVRRLLHADPETGEQPTLRDVPRRWCALDIDGMPLPKGVAPADIFSCSISAILGLPAEFHGGGFVAQATASHGLKPGVRLRLWCWLSRPTTGAELAQWLRGVPHLDAASFSAAQVIFAASPIFEAGKDILKNRLVLVPGPGAVRVPPPEALRPPPPPPPRPLPSPITDRRRRYAAAALRHAAERIATTAEGNRHDTIRREASSLFRLERGGLITSAELREVVAGAAAIAGKTDAREIESLLTWTAVHASTMPLPEGARDGQ